MTCCSRTDLLRVYIESAASGSGICQLRPLRSQGSFDNLCWLAVTDSLFSLYFGDDPERWCQIGACVLCTTCEVLNLCQPGDNSCDTTEDLESVLKVLGIPATKRDRCGFAFNNVIGAVRQGQGIAFSKDGASKHALLVVGYFSSGKVVIFDPLPGVKGGVSTSTFGDFCSKTNYPFFFTTAPRSGMTAVPTGLLEDNKVVEFHEGFARRNSLRIVVLNEGDDFLGPFDQKKKESAVAAVREFVAPGIQDVEFDLVGGVRLRSVDWRSFLDRPSPQREDEILERFFVLSAKRAVVGMADLRKTATAYEMVRLTTNDSIGDLVDSLRKAHSKGASELEILEVPGFGLEYVVIDGEKGPTRAISYGRPARDRMHGAVIPFGQVKSLLRNMSEGYR